MQKFTTNNYKEYKKNPDLIYVPLWMGRMLRKEKIRRCKYCKYTLGVNQISYCDDWCKAQQKEIRRIRIAKKCKYCDNKVKPLFNINGGIASWRTLCDDCLKIRQPKLYIKTLITKNI